MQIKHGLLAISLAFGGLTQATLTTVEAVDASTSVVGCESEKKQENPQGVVAVVNTPVAVDEAKNESL